MYTHKAAHADLNIKIWWHLKPMIDFCDRKSLKEILARCAAAVTLKAVRTQNKFTYSV
jgi:hypothetical protein